MTSGNKVCVGRGVYMGLGEEVKRGYSGGLGHRIINLVYMSCHQGIVHAKKSNIALLSLLLHSSQWGISQTGYEDILQAVYLRGLILFNNIGCAWRNNTSKTMTINPQLHLTLTKTLQVLTHSLWPLWPFCKTYSELKGSDKPNGAGKYTMFMTLLSLYWPINWSFTSWIESVIIYRAHVMTCLWSLKVSNGLWTNWVGF